jgi:hypothetical protein
MKRLPVVIALGVAALAACRIPPFDPGLSLAALSSRNMEHVGTIGPIPDIRSGEGMRYRFVPERDILQGQPLRGWLVAVGPGYLWTTYAYGSTTFSTFPWSSGWIGSAALKPLYDGVTSKLGAIGPSFNGGWIGLVQGDSSTVDDPTNGYFNSLGQYAFAFTALSTTALFGASFGVEAAWPDLTSAGVHLLTTDRAYPSLYHESWATLNMSLLVNPGESMPGEEVTGLPDPATVSSGTYLRNSTYSYFSAKDTMGFWATYRWNHVDYGAQQIGSTRMDSLLSTGNLFARDGDRGIVYGPSGVRNADFPLGDLDFVGEYWNAAEARFHMVFAQPVLVAQENSDMAELRIEIYSLRTSRISSLP